MLPAATNDREIGFEISSRAATESYNGARSWTCCSRRSEVEAD